MTFEQAASVGVTFAVAWIGVAEYTKLRAGETLVVVGASGRAGGAAVQIGAWFGTRVIGIDRYASDPNAGVTRMAERIITAAPEHSAQAIRGLTGGAAQA